jgi:hypothetical protein
MFTTAVYTADLVFQRNTLHIHWMTNKALRAVQLSGMFTVLVSPQAITKSLVKARTSALQRRSPSSSNGGLMRCVSPEYVQGTLSRYGRTTPEYRIPAAGSRRPGREPPIRDPSIRHSHGKSLVCATAPWPDGTIRRHGANGHADAGMGTAGGSPETHQCGTAAKSDRPSRKQMEAWSLQKGEELHTKSPAGLKILPWPM